MKVVAKNIEVIAHFTEEGKIYPIKFKVKEGDNYQVVRILKVISTDLEKLCGNMMRVFVCNVIINNVEKICEIKYDIEGTKWMLFKI